MGKCFLPTLHFDSCITMSASSGVLSHFHGNLKEGILMFSSHQKKIGNYTQRGNKFNFFQWGRWAKKDFAHPTYYTQRGNKFNFFQWGYIKV